MTFSMQQIWRWKLILPNIPKKHVSSINTYFLKLRSIVALGTTPSMPITTSSNPLTVCSESPHESLPIHVLSSTPWRWHSWRILVTSCLRQKVYTTWNDTRILSVKYKWILKEYYEIFSSSHLNRLLSLINIVPKTNLFPKCHIGKTMLLNTTMC